MTRVRSIIGLTLLLAACAASTFDAKRDPVVHAALKTRNVALVTLDFWRVAQLQEFISARAWRPYSDTLPSGYTGIEVQLSTKARRKIPLSVYRHANGGAIFVRISNDLFVSSISSEEMIRFLEIVGVKTPNQAPEPTALLVTPRAGARVAPSNAVAHL